METSKDLGFLEMPSDTFWITSILVQWCPNILLHNRSPYVDIKRRSFEAHTSAGYGGPEGE
jgi:hypothetical protein